MSENKSIEARKKIEKLCKTHKIEAIAIGNGTGGRETEKFVKDALKQAAISNIIVVRSYSKSFCICKTAHSTHAVDTIIIIRFSFSRLP